MGQARKAPIIQAWLDYIPNHGILNTGVFYNSIELYNIFLTDIGSLVTMNGFTKFLNKVANDTGYPNFKRREKRSRNSKEIFYIYSKNDSVNSCNNDRQTRYRKRYPMLLSPPIAKSTSIPMVYPQQIPQQPTPQPIPQLPIPQLTPHLNYPQIYQPQIYDRLSHYPYHPSYVQQMHLYNNNDIVTVPSPSVHPISNNNDIVTVPSPSVHPSFTRETKEYIMSATFLDFESLPRNNAVFPWMPDIIIRDDKTYTTKFYNVMMMTAYDLGYRSLCKAEQLKLAHAILIRESFIAGYSNPLITPETFHRLVFVKFENEKRQNPQNALHVLDSKRGMNRVSYVEKLTRLFPEFLHECFRHAARVCGLAETTKTLCTSMEAYATDTYPDCDIRGKLKMSKHHFWKFFYLHSGKLKQPITKPRLTREHVQKRLAFAHKWIEKLQQGGIYVCFLDEKWFYTSSRRKKLKMLPRAMFETEQQSFTAKPKLRSRRFPVKVMFMGLICPLLMVIQTVGF